MDRIKTRYRYSLILLRELVITDFKLRYQGSVLGYLWSLLRPLALFLVLYIVFVKFLRVGRGIEFYPVYLLLGIMLWNFFLEITAGSVSAIVFRGDLLRKISFPKYVIVLSTSISALINLAINLVVISIFMAIKHVHVIWGDIWLVPLLIAEIYVLGLGIGFFLSAAFVKYRDVGYIWEVILQAAFYGTPILYPISILPTYAQKILILNPVAQAIQGVRYIMVTTQTQTITAVLHRWYLQIIPFVVVGVVIVLSTWYFKRKSRSFAEDV